MVLVGIFFAATGRGGELAYEHADHAPLDLGPVSAADIALLRPPTAMWGYNMQVTDAALDQIARAMRERDVTIAYLQDQLATHERNGSYSEPRGAHARDAAGNLDPPDAFDHPGILETPGPPTIPDALEPLPSPGTLGPPGPPEPSDTLEPSDTPEPSDTLDAPESPEPSAAAEPPAAAANTPDPGPPRTALVLKASGPRPERREPTQPSPILPDPDAARDATEPSADLSHDEEPGEATQPSTTQPSATLAPDDVPGPQGAFDTHGWWAEQQEAAREEQARRRAAGEQDDESVAAAEEQGW